MTNDDERLQNLPFDFYERYILLKPIGEFFRPNEGVMHILDVGGHTPAFWPGFPSMAGTLVGASSTVVVDMHHCSELQNYVCASGCQLPFSDGSFDLVCSLDTLEHLPADQRTLFLSELLRVTRDGIYLAFPYDSPSNKWAENIVSGFADVIVHDPIDNLLEHRQFGLPNREAVQAFLGGAAHSVVQFDQGNTDVWLLMMLTYHSLRYPGTDFVHQLDGRFNRAYAAQDWAPPSYRTGFILSKQKSREALESLKRSFQNPDAAGRVELNAVLSLCQLFLQIAQQGRLVVDKDRHIRNIEAQLADAGPYRDKWNEVVTLLRQLEAGVSEAPLPVNLHETLADWPAERLSRLLDLTYQRNTQLVNTAAERDNLRAELVSAAAERDNLRAGLERARQALADKEMEHVELNSRLEKTSRELAELTEQIKLLQNSLSEERQNFLRASAASAQSVSRLSDHLAQLEARLAANQEAVRRIYDSRTWKALVSLGSVFLRMRGQPAEHLVPVAPPPVAPPPALPERVASPAGPAPSRTILVCDYPGPNGRVPVRGLIEIRGWAIHPQGIREIQIAIDGGSPRPAESGVARPDVARDFPNHPGSDHCGYQYFWNTETVTEGPHTLLVRVIALDGDTAECRCDVLVDPLWVDEYSRWIILHEPDAAAKKRMAEEIRGLPLQPTISIAVPVYKVPLPLLKKCVDSVRAQLYPNWELCLADDGSGDPEITDILRQYASQDERIRFVTLPVNGGIGAATNAALGLSRGEYLAFLDNDDELADFALCEVVRAINDSPGTDLFYSDEDKLDKIGRRYDPFFKPDWSPDLFLSCNYLCHFVVCKRWILDRTGGLDEVSRHGAQDYEFLLRVTEQTQNIRRIAKVLYHWRSLPGSTAMALTEKPRSCEAGAIALREYLERNCPGARVDHFLPCRYRVIYPVDTSQKVTIIMPSGGKLHYLEPALTDIFQKTSYPNFEVLIVDNSSSGAVQNVVERGQKAGHRIQYMDRRRRPFNFSILNNEAVAQVDAPLVLFLNDDITVIDPDWLTAMVEHAQNKKVGAVGALLLYPDGRIQHAGVTLGIYENSGHLFKGLLPKPGANFDLPLVIRNCSAVTAACLLTRREVFLEVGGFDEQNLAVAFQDVDFCLKVHQAGYRIVYTPFARLYHHESVTKAEKVPNPAEVHFMQEKWRSYIENDPYYNPNLTRKDEHYNLRLD